MTPAEAAAALPPLTEEQVQQVAWLLTGVDEEAAE